MCGVDIKSARLPYNLEVRTLTRNQSLITNLVYRNCEIWVGKKKLLVDLVSLDINGYDIIIRMDCLAQYQANLNCRTKIVEFYIPGEATLRLDMKGRLALFVLISGLQVRKLISKRAQGYLAFLINSPSDKMKLKNVPIARDYPDVFSK